MIHSQILRNNAPYENACTHVVGKIKRFRTSTIAKPRTNLHTVISVNKSKLSASINKTKSEYTYIMHVNILQMRKSTAAYCTHARVRAHTHTLHHKAKRGAIESEVSVERDNASREFTPHN